MSKKFKKSEKYMRTPLDRLMKWALTFYMGSITEGLRQIKRGKFLIIVAGVERLHSSILLR
jgi:hypothetical protein